MIQIFGTAKNFDTKKAQMWFKERRIPFQFIDLKEKEMSRGEFESVLDSVVRTAGSRADAVELLADKKSKDYASFAYLDDADKEEKLFENQLLMKLPICRNGKNAATSGLEPKIWENWK
ncbi:MAG: ArsC family transcriptional regulator [Treponema sp.]|nr:ArsC family transcriptional regulator [Treponema sp.]